MKVKALILFLLSILFSQWAGEAQTKIVFQGQSEGQNFLVEQVAEGLGVPWALVCLSPSDVLFTIRSGKIGILHLPTGRIRFLSGGPRAVRDSGQGGMLDAAVPPDWTPGGWIYFTYSKQVGNGGATTLSRARFRGDGFRNFRLTGWQDLLVTRSGSRKTVHYGSRLAFDDKGYIYMTVGDRGNRPNAQDLKNHAGKVLRLNRDGSPPADNPFREKAGALPEIYSYGHRNPQGIVFDPVHSKVWAIEHGPRGGDEINLILPGANYGWPVVSHGKEYWGPFQVGEGTHKEGMAQPVKVYVPSIAPGSLLRYSGKAFPGWKGNLMSGALKLRHLNRVVLDDAGNAVAEERLLEELEARIRGLAESPEGWIYLSTDSGHIYRLRPDGS
ncbi:MAG TPA: dehydrogenase [Desulfobacteraceae bacterium]|nr:dehydrogenase [Desulfobacteraceae bacterium]